MTTNVVGPDLPALSGKTAMGSEGERASERDGEIAWEIRGGGRREAVKEAQEKMDYIQQEVYCNTRSERKGVCPLGNKRLAM